MAKSKTTKEEPEQEVESKRTMIEVSLEDRNYVIAVDSDQMTLYRRTEKSDIHIGYYKDLTPVLKKIAREYMSSTGKDYDVKGYIKAQNEALKKVSDAVGW